MNNKSPFNVCPVEDIASPTPEPETNQPSPCLYEPIADREPAPTAIDMPSQPRATEPTIAWKLEPEDLLDQVREPATSCVAVGVLVEIEGLEISPAYTPVAECELQLDSSRSCISHVSRISAGPVQLSFVS